MRRAVSAVLVGLLLLAAGCAPRAPRPIAYGEEPCDQCRMAISDARFGAELVTAKGRIYVFDSIECLGSFTLDQSEAPRGLWVTDYNRPGTLLPVDSASFHQLTGAAGSPMGRGLVATRRGEGPRAGGSAGVDVASAMAWPDVLASLRAGDMAGEAPHGH